MLLVHFHRANKSEKEANPLKGIAPHIKHEKNLVKTPLWQVFNFSGGATFGSMGHLHSHDNYIVQKKMVQNALSSRNGLIILDSLIGGSHRLLCFTKMSKWVTDT